ncbi:hypothetical protein MA16_Dca011112 [Dendrobium catenatum]|uniref:Uncharacterized protein n=1 Tax=Dendrobium catenatum TaxID=906689 RepID=A0A2I0WSA8_9ASPA|nr:hypothetical protein MA16_Dca011112 [Dendrobium catenatum]
MLATQLAAILLCSPTNLHAMEPTAWDRYQDHLKTMAQLLGLELNVWLGLSL